MLSGLIGNASVLLALILAYSLLLAQLPRAGLRTQLLSGGLFGLAAVVGMTFPATLAPGVFFDARTVVVSMAGLFGGPMVAGISALIAAAYRAWLGGGGVFMGIGIIVTAATMGGLFHALRRAGRVRVDLKTLIVFSLAVHLLALAWVSILPAGLRGEVLHHVALPFLLVLPAVGVLLGLLLRNQEQLIDDERSMRVSRDRLLALSDTLRRERDRLQQVLETVDTVILALDPADRVMLINRKGCQLLGGTPAQLEGKDWFVSTTPPDMDVEQARAAFRAQAQHGPGSPEPLTTRVLTRDGRERHITWRVSLVEEQDGAILGLLAAGDDVTERDLLRRRVETIARHVPGFIYQYQQWPDGRGAFPYVSHGIRQILGLDPADLIADAGPALRMIDRRDAERVQASIAESMRTLEPWQESFRVSWPDGRTIWLEAESSPEAWGDGSVVWYGHFRDITERMGMASALAERELFFRESQRAASIGSYRADFDADRWESSDVLDEIFGIDKAYGRTIQSWLDLVHPDDRARMQRYLQDEVLAAGRSFDQSYRIVRPCDGATRWVLGLGRITQDAQGRVLTLQGTIQDITERKRAESDALETNATLEAALSSMRDAVVVIDPTGRLVHANAAFAAFHRCDRIEDCPRVLTAYTEILELRSIDGALLPIDEWPIARALRGEAAVDQEYRLRRKDTGETWIGSYNLAPILGGGGRTIGGVMTCRDVTDIKAHEAKLDYLAHHDLLTGLANRRLLTERLDEAIVRADRNGQSLALCYLDLDGFKALNDEHGHDLGDQFLIKISMILRQVLRGNDCVARLGGDEFVLLLTDLRRTEDCRPLVDRVLTSIRQPIRLNGITHQVSASIGVALYPTDYSDADTLLRHADQAMYRAKEAGKNHCRFYDPQQERGVTPRFSHDELVELSAALAEGDFRLYFQPQVDLISREVIGVEALIRWQHPDKGLLPPAAFLPQVEGTPLEWDIGNWVIDTALRQLGEWNALGLRLSMGINIGAGQLMADGFAARLAEHLQAHPAVSPSDLELEILESTAFSDFEKARHILADCLELGVSFALDDFGTGYSSLAYFRALPIELLKIDQCFVRDMLDDPGDMEIVESVVRLSQAFNRAVIAEGIETLEHAALLTWLGCRRGQGFGIARPMPAADLPGWISRWSEQPGWPSAENPSGREDIQVLVAAQNHLHWINRVTRILKALDVPDGVDLSATECAFGRWYAGRGAEHYGQLPNYGALGALHTSIHALADELLAQASEGDRQAAIERLPALHGLRDQLLAAMGELVQQLRPMR